MSAAIPPQSAADGAPHYAGFWVRALALFIDVLAIGVIASAVTLGRAGIVIWDPWLQLEAWRILLEMALSFLYFSILWSRIAGGQTLGMRLLGLRVIATDGSMIPYRIAVIRWIGFVAAAAVVLAGLISVAFDLRKQGWHDKMASTFVVHLNR
ncbi:MAG: RDD family protein [Candidatus Limnocylindria bacterium]